MCGAKVTLSPRKVQHFAPRLSAYELCREVEAVGMADVFENFVKYTSMAKVRASSGRIKARSLREHELLSSHEATR